MPVVGMNIKNINAKKNEEAVGTVRVNSDTNLKEMREQDLPALKTKGLAIEFEFKTEYTNEKKEKIAEITVGGDVLFIDEKYERILKGWKKDKKLPDDIDVEIINAILRKNIVRALTLSDELQLPAPVAIPFVRKKQQDSNYIG